MFLIKITKFWAIILSYFDINHSKKKRKKKKNEELFFLLGKKFKQIILISSKYELHRKSNFSFFVSCIISYKNNTLLKKKLYT